VFVPGAAAAGESELTVEPDTLPVGQTAKLTATVADAHANPVAGVEVTFWTRPAIPALGEGRRATTGAGGVASLGATTAQAGVYIVYATVGGKEIKGSGKLTVRFTAGPAVASKSTLSVPTERTGRVVVANGRDQHTARVVVRDADANPVVGAEAVVEVEDPTGQRAVVPSGVSGADGAIEAGFSTTLAGVYRVTATIKEGRVLAVVTGSPAVATFRPGPAEVTKSEITVSKTVVEANGRDATQVTVRLRDREGNAIATGGDVVTILSTWGKVGPVVDQGNGSYVAPLTASREGRAVIGHTVNGVVGSVGGAEVLFVATPRAPVIDYANASDVVGRAEAGNRIEVTDAAGAVVCTVVVPASGTFTCSGMQPPRADGEKLQVVSRDPHGFASPPAEATVNATAPPPPAVDPTAGDQITGTGTPGTTVTVVDPGSGAELCQSVVGPDGRFECGPLVPPLTDGQSVEVVLTDGSGNGSAPTTVVVDARAPGAPQVEATDGSMVYGQAEPASHVTVTDAGGKVLCEALADPVNGAFACQPNRPVADREVLSLTAADAAGNVSPPATVVVDGAVPPVPWVAPTNGSVISGRGVPGLTIEVVLPGGQVLTAVVGGDGRWSVTPPAGSELSDGDIVIATQIRSVGDRFAKRSDPVKARVDGAGPSSPVPAPTAGRELTGTGEPGATVTVRDPVGNVIGGGLVGGDGTWRVVLEPAQTPGHVLTVTQRDAAGNESAAQRWLVGVPAATVERDRLPIGAQQAVRVSGFQPGESVALALDGGTASLGVLTADSHGLASLTWEVSGTVALGAHVVTAVGGLSGRVESGPFTVTAAMPVADASTRDAARLDRDRVQQTVEGSIEAASPVASAPHREPVVVSHPATGLESLIPVTGVALGAALAGALVLLAGRRRLRVQETRLAAEPRRGRRDVTR
jgi:hypothetical protein